MIVGCYLVWQPGKATSQTIMTPVRLCTSVPIGSPGLRPLARGIDDAVTLAGEQWRARFQKVHLALLSPVFLDDATADGSGVDPIRERRNAQVCLARHDTFGYIGPLNSPVAPYSMPILNRGGMVQISPGNTLPTLTSPSTRAAFEPATYHRQLLYVTYYRTITTDALQGPSAAAYLKQRLGATSYFLVDDQLQYGAGVAGAMKAYAQKIGLQLVGAAHLNMQNRSTWASSLTATAEVIAARHPDGVLYGGGAWYLGGPKVSLFKDLRRNGYSGPVVGVDSIVVDSISAFTSSGERNLFGTIPGADIQVTSPSFRRAYTRRFRVQLHQFDASAYDAAGIALNVIYRAAAHGELRGSLFRRRAAVLPYVAHVRWHGALGLTSFDRNGDTRNRIVSVYAVRNGAWVYVGKAPKVLGVSPTQ
jgi:branched-chain amino acid transport system substrate-binding protein